MARYWVDWASNSFCYSKSSFFFFWKIFSEKIIYGKNFRFLVFFLKISKILFSNRRRLFKKTLKIFFCFSFISQLSFDNLKPDEFSFKILFFIFKNIIQSSKNFDNTFKNLFIKTILFFPDGLSIKSNFLYILISKTLFYLHLKILKKSLFIGKILMKFQKNGNKNDIVAIFLLKIFLKDFTKFLPNNFFAYIKLTHTSVVSTIKKKNYIFLKEIGIKNFTNFDMQKLNARFFLITISYKKRKSVNLTKKIPSFNLNNKKNDKIFFSTKNFFYSKAFFKINIILKKKKHKKKKFKSKKFIGYFNYYFLNISFLVSNFFLVNYIMKKNLVFYHFRNVMVFFVWQDYQTNELCIKQHLKSILEKKILLKNSRFDRRIYNLSFELLFDKMNRKKKLKKNHKWILKNIERSADNFNSILKWKNNIVQPKPTLLIFFFEFLIFGLLSPNYQIEKIFFISLIFFIGKSNHHFYSTKNIYEWKNNIRDFDFFGKNSYLLKKFYKIEQKKFFSPIIFLDKDRYRFNFFKKFELLFPIYFINQKKIQKWIEKMSKQTFQIVFFFIYFSNKKFFKSKIRKIFERNFLLFSYCWSQVNFFSNFLKLNSFFKKENFNQKKRNSQILDRKIYKIKFYRAMFFCIFFQKCHFCDILWNFSPKNFYFFIENIGEKFSFMDKEKKKILIIFFHSTTLTFIKFKNLSKKKYSIFFKNFGLNEYFSLCKKNSKKSNQKLVNQEKKRNLKFSFFFLFYKRTKKNQ
ncbi:hypothetical protein CMESO_278 (nucleomorph) [Chroomonas mesostigmatica CCMP1168]|uniref:Uncharacterized protein n=1 Tax=Chroomonas mesostigmatica CCMP1168 TaxID=1195612 RepID=J7G335_9CRYP|nr:hypothetical protein CMESO_278 [Chroomonas mesostigmatica CCMP1168]